MIVVPSGLVGLDFAKGMTDPIYGNRSQRFTYELLDLGEAPMGSLPGVTGGSIEWHSNAKVKAGGKVTVVTDKRTTIPWLKRRIKITMHIAGKGSYPLGVFIPSAPVERWDDTGLTLDIELLDKCSVLDNDYVLNTHSVASGANVTAAVRALITSTGENAGSITDGTETLVKALHWESGTSKLEIINDLLSAANYFSLRSDGDGNFRVEKHRLPGVRPTVHEFIDNENAIYTADFSYEKDEYSIPNKVVLITNGDAEGEGMKAVAINANPNSPYSTVSRGRTIVDITKGVEATDQAALDARAVKRLHELTSPSGILSINHAPLPWLNINEVVRFKRSGADLDIRCLVASTMIDLDPAALQRTALEEVVAL